MDKIWRLSAAVMILLPILFLLTSASDESRTERQLPPLKFTSYSQDDVAYQSNSTVLHANVDYVYKWVGWFLHRIQPIDKFPYRKELEFIGIIIIQCVCLSQGRYDLKITVTSFL